MEKIFEELKKSGLNSLEHPSLKLDQEQSVLSRVLRLDPEYRASQESNRAARKVIRMLSFEGLGRDILGALKDQGNKVASDFLEACHAGNLEKLHEMKALYRAEVITALGGDREAGLIADEVYDATTKHIHGRRQEIAERNTGQGLGL